MQEVHTIAELLARVKGHSPLKDMMPWFKKQGGIIAFDNGDVITDDPHAFKTQNCQNILRNEGLIVDRVIISTANIIKDFIAEFEKQDALKDHSAADQNLSRQQKILRNLISEAFRETTSDIHLEVRKNYTNIRFRRFGILEQVFKWTDTMGREVAAVAFNNESEQAVENFNPTKSQNAIIETTVDGTKLRIRVATIPCYEGFDMVMRILREESQTLVNLAELGYTPQQINLLEEAIRKPSGAIIVAGPTGSGKSTTIASCLQKLPIDKKIYTVEDPVEYKVDNATQISINTDKNSDDYGRMLRAIMRMDPDVMVIGEIRDAITANIMVHAAITGHLVFTTIHTKRAVNIILRLIDMGVSSMTLSDPSLMVALVAQRLIPTVCPACCIPLLKSDRHAPYLKKWKSILGDPSKINVRNVSSNCPECHGTGIQGRTSAAEVIWIDENTLEFIQKNNMLEWLKYLKKRSWQSMDDRMIQLIQEGKCDPLDIEDNVGNLSELFGVKEFNY